MIALFGGEDGESTPMKSTGQNKVQDLIMAFNLLPKEIFLDSIKKIGPTKYARLQKLLQFYLYFLIV